MNTSGLPALCSGHGLCLQLSGDCFCNYGYTGSDCGSCAGQFTRVIRNGPCRFMLGSLVNCSDGVQNGNEAGVDCGGPNCDPCKDISGTGPDLFLLVFVGIPVVFVGCGLCTWYLARRRSQLKSSRVEPQTAITSLAVIRQTNLNMNAKKVAPILVGPNAVPRSIVWEVPASALPVGGQSHAASRRPQAQITSASDGGVDSALNLVVDWSAQDRPGTTRKKKHSVFHFRDAY